jgi:hypothetical protein
MKTLTNSLRALTLLGLLGALAACGGNDGAPPANNPDMACANSPTTYVQIINACTTADSVNKMPFFPALAPNGQLPQLP